MDVAFNLCMFYLSTGTALSKVKVTTRPPPLPVTLIGLGGVEVVLSLLCELDVKVKVVCEVVTGE